MPSVQERWLLLQGTHAGGQRTPQLLVLPQKLKSAYQSEVANNDLLSTAISATAVGRVELPHYFATFNRHLLHSSLQRWMYVPE
mmetsp:Transcript_63806/g.138744  ORF Transcript_63806/g.138744 Transcript_63806/m.138744 type:complete len:84 (-) Transcript_63806:8-259(-)